MSEIRKIVKVFLASPGDLTDERKAAKGVVDEFNDLLAEEFGYQVDLVGWEDTVSAYGRPQETINQELRRCELFIGLMWKRWGTPPDKEGRYTSGFEEEFSISVEKRLKEKKPEISLFFKIISDDLMLDPGEDLKKVLDFKESLIAEKQILFEEFGQIDDFQKKFRKRITTYVRSLKARDKVKHDEQKQTPSIVDDQTGGSKPKKVVQEPPLSSQGTKFLLELISKTENASEPALYSSVEAARFRLLSSFIGTQSNDDMPLGVHDSNLLYLEKKHLNYGRKELFGLAVSGLEFFASNNTPLWHWYSAVEGEKNLLLPFYSQTESTAKRRANAIKAMQLIAEQIPKHLPWYPTKPNDRYLFIDSWFKDDSDTSVRIAALSYLAEYGIESDLEVIHTELNRNDNQTAQAAVGAILRITLRDNREAAIKALYDLQPTSVDVEILEDLFNKGSALSTEFLLKGIHHQNHIVRRIVVKHLYDRCALPENIAESLMSDSDAMVRYTALTSLSDAGRYFSIDDAKKILVSTTNLSRNLLWGTDTIGEDYLKKFKRRRLSKLKDSELEEAVKAEVFILDRDAQLVLEERHFHRHHKRLQAAVDDQCKAEFSQAYQTTIKTYGHGEYAEKVKSIEDVVRKEMTRQKLNII
ncbi:MAG: DUF4062 domain-containing protein, partial [Magnetococcales bacterium]|nr:DUF4062 domain-containing protein [Magnetococcales bacterium]